MKVMMRVTDMERTKIGSATELANTFLIKRFCFSFDKKSPGDFPAECQCKRLNGMAIKRKYPRI